MKRLAAVVAIVSLALVAGLVQLQAAEPASAPVKGQWVNVSDKVIKALADDGKKPGYPGLTAGIAVDRVTGDVYMVVPDQGIWKSTDKGETFTRADGGKIGGRCETGFALNFDPNGKRLACFMLDGAAGYTLDDGKTWPQFKGNGRGWDAASVDWSAKEPTDIFALRHESGGEVFSSTDMGKNWKLIGKGFSATGIFDAKTFVATKEKEKGIMYSTDAGATWTKVSDLQPAGRDIRIFKGVAYWTSGKGLLVSKDKGKTWDVQGAAVDCSYGPFFGKDEKHIVVAGPKGFFESTDAGDSWKLAAPLPPEFKVAMPGWFLNLGWDPNADIFYASTMGKSAFKYQR